MDRSENMRRIRSRDSRPELIVRRLLFRLGYRYRLHSKKLPGKPDLVFPGRRKALFVHGCFWHGHENCKRTHQPKSNTAYWSSKIKKNIERDRHALEQLAEMGWKILIIWECETMDSKKVEALCRAFLTEPDYTKQ